MDAGTLMRDIRNQFEALLQRKTGWGRNEVLREFDRATLNVLLKVPDIKFTKDNDLPF